MRAAFDSNPSFDPTQRNPGMSSSGMRSHAGRGGGGGMYADELNPEDLFNMFFGGGGRGGQFGGGQFGNANGESRSRHSYHTLTNSVHFRRWERIPSDRGPSSTTSSGRSGCQSHCRPVTNYYLVRVRPHISLAIPTVRFHGAGSRIYFRTNGQILDGQKYMAKRGQVLCRQACMGGFPHLAIGPRGEKGQEGYGHVQPEDQGLRDGCGERLHQ